MKIWRRFLRASLQRRLFMAFGMTIVLTVLAVGITMHVTQPEGYDMHERYAQMKRFASARFAKVWDNPAERRELARGLSESFGVDLVIKNQSGQVVERLGSSCRHLLFSIQVTRDGEELGSVETCPPQGHRRKLTSFLLALAAAVLTLWMGSGAIARKLARPLAELASVTHDLGQGKLKRRARLRQHDPGELGELASSINEMAERIAKQLDDQRELLAAVSHEIRTPLARLRVLIDLLADAGCDQELTGQLEREVLEIDHLTEDLLASSRLEFQAVNHTALDPNMLAARALERCNLPEGLLQPESAQATIHGDATLLGRALTNLLINAECHGGGVDRLIVAQGDGRLTFTVTDRGPGFTPSALQHAFDRFFRDENPRRKAGSALGLGLALVRRIARAHAGEAFADNREGGGAQVGFWVCSQQQ